MDKLASLEMFRRVAQARSFTVAAQALGISPAMASKAIAQLEAAVGARLLARSTRAVSLTEAGEQYLRTIAPLLDELLLAERQLQADIAQPRGELRLSAPIDLGEQLLPRVLERFSRACPAVTVQVDLTSRQVDLHNEPIDLALRVGRINQSTLIVRHLTELPLVVCAAPAYLRAQAPIAHPRDLGQQRCLVNASVGDALRWRFQEQGRSFSIAPNAVLQASSSRLLVELACAGQGVAYLPRYLVRDALAAGLLESVLDGYVLPPLPVSAAYVERRYQAVKVQRFIELLVAELAVGESGQSPRS
jgi:DNA-binding transcriptional LysR family regulator